jgi:hypothetical protein
MFELADVPAAHVKRFHLVSVIEFGTLFLTCMSSIALIQSGEQRQISARDAIMKFKRFEKDRTLIHFPDRVRLIVPAAIFRQFALALKGNPIEITEDSFPGLSPLYQESVFTELYEQPTQFHDSHAPRNWRAPKREVESLYLKKKFSTTTALSRGWKTKSRFLRRTSWKAAA